MILIVDDEKYIRSSLAGLLADEGYDTGQASSAEEAERLLAGDAAIELILLDIQMPGKDGITFLDDNAERLRDIPVIIISGRSDIATAVKAIKLGSFDFIEKPLVPERILVTVRQALRLSRSLHTEKKLTDHILDRYRLIGESAAMRHLRAMIDKAADSDSTVLLSGDSGTGKELVAHHIHYRSRRKGEPLVAVNCPAIPEQLFESELFGHVRGAFTGASGDRTGRFEAAGTGTVFLDEIGDVPLGLQSKLLRVLENGCFEKVGSDATISAQCRVVAASNRDLPAMIGDRQFREDLYYRLNVLTVRVPSLAERLDDIPLLINHFLAAESAAAAYRMTSEAMGIMASLSWPGNIRQLRNVVAQLIFGCEPGEITAADVQRVYNIQQGIATAAAPGENRLTAAVRQFETGFLADLLRKHEGNIAAMARELNMDRGNLSKKLKALNIV